MVSIFIKLEIYEKMANNVKENGNIRLFLVGKQFFHVVFCACVRNWKYPIIISMMFTDHKFKWPQEGLNCVRPTCKAGT